jgi:hypothetical protein
MDRPDFFTKLPLIGQKTTFVPFLVTTYSKPESYNLIRFAYLNILLPAYQVNQLPGGMG